MKERATYLGAGVRARRVLAVLECRPSDESVCARAVELLEEVGGSLTIVATVPRRFPWVNAGPHCTPGVSDDDLRQQAASSLARAAALVPPWIALLTTIEEGRTSDIVRRRVEIAAPDVVVLRGCRRRRLAQLPVPVVAC